MKREPFDRTSPSVSRIARSMCILALVLVLSIVVGTTPAVRASTTNLNASCASQIDTPFATIPVSWLGDVGIEDFEQISATKRRALGNNRLAGDVDNISVQTVPPSVRPSFFFLTSLSPIGNPFFPAIAETESYMSLDIDLFDEPLTNEAPIVLRSNSPVNSFPPPQGVTVAFSMTDDVVFTNSLGDTLTVLQGATAFLSRPDVIPTLNEWGLIVLVLLLVLAAMYSYVSRRRKSRAEHL